MTDEHLHRAMAHELEIVWLQDITDIDYVRQGAYLLWTRTRAPGKNTGERRVVGYATVGPAARGVRGYFLRRVFWLKLYDRAYDPRGPYRTGTPAEAVDPRTVRPRVAGEVTPRASEERRP
jgi:hypothetical protein